MTSNLSEAKAGKIAEIAWALDADSYSIGVVSGFPYGRPRELRDPRHEELMRLAGETA